MRAHQHESTCHESANFECAKYGKPNIHIIAPDSMLKAVFVQLIKPPISFLYYY